MKKEANDAKQKITEVDAQLKHLIDTIKTITNMLEDMNKKLKDINAIMSENAQMLNEINNDLKLFFVNNNKTFP